MNEALRIETMKQAELGLNPTTKPTRKREFVDEMSRFMQWTAPMEEALHRVPLLGEFAGLDNRTACGHAPAQAKGAEPDASLALVAR